MSVSCCMRVIETFGGAERTLVSLEELWLGIRGANK